MKAGELPRELLEFFLPRGCLGCGVRLAPSVRDTPVCGRCRTRVRVPPAPRCARCDAPLGTGRAPTRPCIECLDWPEAIRSARVAAVLQPPASSLVHALKYEGWSSLGPWMAGRMAARTGKARDAVVVPVPTTPRRERKRGYNQARVLAEAFASACGARFLDALSRPAAEGTQVSLPGSQRRANVRGAFLLRDGLRTGLREARIILVDDVLTTGATVSEAASTLAGAGVRAVDVVAFARALPTLTRWTSADEPPPGEKR